MLLSEIISLLESGDVDKCVSVLKTHCLVKSVSDAVKQYDPGQHAVMNRQDRPIFDDSNNADKESQIVDYVKLPLALQKKIVTTAAAFIGKVQFDATPTNQLEHKLVAGIKKVWNDNKLDYRFINIKKATMSLKQCAELWRIVSAEKNYWAGTGIEGSYKLKVNILSADRGDELYPVFDDFGDMIAFGHGYKLSNEKGIKESRFDVYTPDMIYFSKKDSGNSWLFSDPSLSEGNNYSSTFVGVPNPIGKIPVIYYYQPLTEWSDVQWLIDRLEEILSNHADTNDYVGSPIVFAENADEITFPQKGETGKLIQGNNGAKMSYLTYDSQPKSVQMEIDNLVKYIFSLTHTPDIAFENLKTLGYFSNIALQTLFIDARIKATDKEEIFGEGIQRRLNFIKASLTSIDVSLQKAKSLVLSPKFNFSLIKNNKDLVLAISEAVSGGIMSKRSALKKNPLITNPSAEIELINKAKQ